MKKMFSIALLALCIPAFVFANGASEKTSDATSNKIEIFSWWTAGGEAEGLDALIKVFEAKNPTLMIENSTVAGGAGSNAKAVLATRMQGGDPPDTFQVHAGHELIDTWVVSDFMEPITFIMDDNGWRDSYPQDVIDIVSYEGEVYSIPVNVHRSNVMWVNPKLFAKYGLEFPKSIDDFFKVAKVFKDNGVDALALGDTKTWPATQLLENVILAVAGPDKYSDLWKGNCRWDDPSIVAALETYVKILGYVNSDHAAITDMDAGGYVAEGKAAMNVMGDWLAGYYDSQNYVYKTDWDWVPFPGTNNEFIMLSDSFGLPKNAPNRDNVIKWLETCGSKDGQDAFNPIKGSIPARTDCDTSKYSPYLQDAMADFATNRILPSVAHGAAISEAWLTKISDIINVFTTSKDVNQAVKSFQAAADKYAPTK
ncbi:MAG: carbohydrate ABC transporter substrate-binding protein [Peptostreptococcaceae bacterium]|nr:carbohydrate ABC transporter substrate-binding protein [Peptostreptococcaceae bacterium]